MAILFLIGDVFERAKAEVGDEDREKLIAKAKELSPPGGYLEGDNEFIHNKPGYIRFLDEEKPKKEAKKAKKGKK